MEDRKLCFIRWNGLTDSFLGVLYPKLSECQLAGGLTIHVFLKKEPNFIRMVLNCLFEENINILQIMIFDEIVDKWDTVELERLESI